jgi:hypothetical protein
MCEPGAWSHRALGSRPIQNAGGTQWLKIAGAFLGVILFSLSLSLTLQAQQNLGKLIGVVRDPTGAVVPNASVAAKAVSTGVETEVRTNAQGEYEFQKLAIGEYILRVTGSGFKTLEQPSVRILSGTTTPLDFQLEVGATTQTVQVTARVAAVDTSAESVGTTRSMEEIVELPLMQVGTQRSALTFIRTFPGVTPNIDVIDDNSASRGISVTSINGAPAGNPRLSYDGTYASSSGHGGMYDPFSVPPEAVDEVRISFANTSEYGWDDGVSVNIVTRGGSNQLHGDLYEYFRNVRLDARNWFAKNRGDEKQNEFGATVGGPVMLPGYDGRDKTFFYFFYGGFRFRSTGTGQFRTVPTALMRQGDFSEWLGPQLGTDLLGRPIYKYEIYDPLTTRPDGAGGYIRDPFMYNGQLNVIDPSRFSKISTFFQNAFPAPTLPGISANWVGNLRESPNNLNKEMVRIDHNFAGGRQRLTFWGAILRRRETLPGTFAHTYLDGSFDVFWADQHMKLNYGASLGTNKYFSLRLDGNILTHGDLPQSPGLGQTGCTDSGLALCFSPFSPQLSMGNSGISGGSAFAGTLSTPQWNFPIDTDLSWVKKSHTLKFGAQYLNNNQEFIYCFTCAGSYNFSENLTRLPDAPATALPLSGNGYASFLLGDVYSASIQTPGSFRFNGKAWGLYAQDTWRVTPKFTLNFGLRWDDYIQQHEHYNQMVDFDPTIPNPGAGGLPGALTFWGVGPGRNGLQQRADSSNLFLPRIGFSYAPTPNLVIRGAYANSSDMVIGVNTSGGGISGGPATAGYAPFGSISSLDSGVTSPFNWNTGFPRSAIPSGGIGPTILNGASPAYWDIHNMRAGRSQNWDFGIERQLRGGIIVKADYVGNNIKHLPVAGGADLNQIPDQYLSLGTLLNADAYSAEAVAAGIKIPYAGFKGSVGQALRPYPQYTAINCTMCPMGYNYYHSLQLNAQKHFSQQGLTFLVAYTIAKTITNVAGFGGQGIGNESCQDWYNRKNCRFQEYNTRPQVLSLSYVYDLPFGPGKRWGQTTNRVTRNVIGGWRVSGIHQYFSGPPIQILYFNRVPGVPITGNATCGTYNPSDPAHNKYLNAAAFTVPPAFTYGNTYQLPVRMCGYANENVSLQKLFHPSERTTLEFSADAANLLNRHAWTGVATNPTVASYGTITGASSPRVFQFHAKVLF